MTWPRRAVNLLRGVGALALMCTVAFGLPAALAHWVGWPLPTTLPDLDALDRAARSGLGDEVIVNTLAVLAWLAWAQVAMALVAEVVAVVRRRPVVHLPVLPGIQPVVARLVASVVMTASTVSPAVALAAAPFATPVAAAQMASPAPVAVGTVTPTSPFTAADAGPPSALATEDWSLTETPEAPPVAPAATVAVERHDSYWALAERTLGDGLRWRELRDLNVGRAMPDGHVVQAGSDLLRPGWILHLPPSPGAAVPPPSNEPPAVAPQVMVERGDNLWAIAEDQVATGLGRTPTDDEIRPYWETLISANGDEFVRPGNPGLIYAGQALTLPPPQIAPPAPPAVPAPPGQEPTEAGEPPSPPPPPQPSPPATTVPAPTEPRPSEPPPTTPKGSDPVQAPAPTSRADPNPATHADDDGSIPLPAVVVAGGLASATLAVGAKRAIERRRRRFNESHPGRSSRRTPRRDQQVHREIVANADEESVEDLRTRLGLLAEDLAEAGHVCRPRIVQHDADHLDLYLDTPSDQATAGWSVDGDGAIWTRDADQGKERRTTDTCAAPLLVAIGQPDEDGQLYLDLEADGLIAFAGEPDVARGLARSIITEVALSPLADTVRVLVVGDLIDERASGLDHVSLVDSWDDATADVSSWAAQSHQLLVDNEWPQAFTARGADPDHDALAALLVVAAEPPAAEVVAELAERHPAAVAVVIAGSFDGARCVIDCQPDRLTVTDLGLTCVPQRLDDDTLASMVRILEGADEEDDEFEGEGLPDGAVDPNVATGEDAEIEVDDAGRVNPASPAAVKLRDDADGGPEQPELFPADEGHEDSSTSEEPDVVENRHDPVPEHDILVRLLGEIRIEGGRPLQAKATAVVAYLALHREVSVEALEDACWREPGAGTARKRLKNTMSEARAALGSHHLPVATDGRYSTGNRVITDTEIFDRLVALAATQPPARKARTYRSALALVTGKAFTYPSRSGSSFGWIDTANLRSRWEMRIEGVARQCAETFLALGDAPAAIEAVRHALASLPLNTALTETLMRSHAAAGDRDAVDAVYREHAAGLQHVDQNEEPAESTHRLREELVDARRAGSSSDWTDG